MNDSIPASEAPRNEAPIRLLVLGAVYAVAAFFAVAFSPAVGFGPGAAAPDGGRIASAEAPQRIEQ